MQAEMLVPAVSAHLHVQLLSVTSVAAGGMGELGV
jgi:hypothetical protein